MFVAVYPDSAAAQRLADAAAAAQIDRARLTPAGQLHVTMLFIGDVMPSHAESVIDSVEHACRAVSPFVLRCSAITALPARGMARVVAAIAEPDPQLLELRKRLASRLAQARAPSSAFLPHITVARFPPPGLAVVRREIAITPIDSRIDRVMIMESRLLPAGAIHTPVAEVPLTP